MASRRRNYTREFKLKALNLVLQGGCQFEEMADSLGIDRSQLSHWEAELLADGSLTVPGHGEQMTEHSEDQGDGLSVRPAVHADGEDLFFLRNLRCVRAGSFQADPIRYEEHVAWFEGRLASPDCRIFVLCSSAAFAGQIRYDRNSDHATISFALLPAFRRRGLGKSLIEETSEEACAALGVSRVVGEVRPSNVASCTTFERAGFKCVSKNEAIFVFEKRIGC